MAATGTSPFDDMVVDHVEFYVEDVVEVRDRFVYGYGLDVDPAAAARVGAGPSGAVRSVVVGRNRIRLLLTQPLIDDHPAAAYVERHGEGVAGIALGVADAAAAFEEAVRRGGRPVSPPSSDHGVVTATIVGFGDVVHTFVQRDRAGGAGAAQAGGLQAVDHFAVCVEADTLAGTVEYYRTVLDFETIFSERVAVGPQAMTTTVVQSRSGHVTLTLIEPDVSRVAGHIDGFLKDHGGPGVQHVAFSSTDIVAEVDRMGGRGVRFLHTPDTYYRLLPGRLETTRHPVDDLGRRSILVDHDHDGQLYQIFTESEHPRGTLFMELIERHGARSFGSGNIAALYQAVELQRERDTTDRRPGEDRR